MGKYIKKTVKIEDITVDGEVWKEIPIEYLKNEYLISNLGRVYSKVSNRLLKLITRKDGYVQIPIGRVGEKRKGQRIHRLVAMAFIPNPFNKKEVNHKNKNRSDNRVENLEWSTPQENSNFKYNITYWNNKQGRISASDYSVARRKLIGFSEKIIPLLKEIVPIG